MGLEMTSTHSPNKKISKQIIKEIPIYLTQQKVKVINVKQKHILTIKTETNRVCDARKSLDCNRR